MKKYKISHFLLILFIFTMLSIFPSTSHAEGKVKIGTLPVQNNKLSTPLGLEIFGGGFSAIFKEGVELPTSYEENFGLANSSAKFMKLKLYYGHKMVAKQNKLLSHIIVTGFNPEPNITLRIELNEQGEVFASAHENKKELEVSGVIE